MNPARIRLALLSSPFFRARIFSCLSLLAVLGLPACGGDEPAVPSAAPKPLLVRTFDELPPIPAEERAAYAFERLVRGPEPLGGLPVRKIHPLNLRLASADLLALEEETLAILEDPKVIERYVGMARRNADPWHNILRVLLALPSKPVDLVLAWTRPALTFEDDEASPTLRREAARVLATVRDPRVAETLLELFRANPVEREMGVLCFSALLRQGSPWRERVLELVLREGPPSLWSDAAVRISSLVPLGEEDPLISAAMTWWAALVAGSGPRITHVLPRVKHMAWSPARLALDEAVAQTPSGARALPGAPVYGPLPSVITHGTGWNPADLSHAAVFPMYAYVLTGKMPAAESRCALALWGYPAYVKSVEADLDKEESDAGLYWTARHCMIGAEIPVEDVRSQLAAELNLGGPWSMERIVIMRRLVASLPGCTDPVDWDLHERILREMRPLTECRAIIERTYDQMRLREPDLIGLVEGMLLSEDLDARGVALHLIRRAREPAYLDALETWLDRTTDPQEIAILRRTLPWMYSRGRSIEPDRYAQFVRRFEGWLADLDDRQAAGLATALLDFGDAGAEAFARGLQGERRTVFLAGWPRDRRIVPLLVAEAAIAPVDADTPLGEVAALLSLAYGSFPETAAAAVAAMAGRVSKPAAALVPPVLKRIRHRAAR